MEAAESSFSTCDNVSRDELLALLECSVCLSMLCEPITIACGHTFCRRCLVNSLKRHKKKCPSCRAVCHTSAEDADENSILKSIVTTLNPELYKQRLAETEAEKIRWDRTLPIFYYNSPVLPGGKLFLHLFEPRYKLMMQRIVNGSRQFAYVPNFTNYQGRVGDVAIVAVLQEVEFFSDGRCQLEASLTTRNRIIECFEEAGTGGLDFCRLQEFSDEPVEAGDRDQCDKLLIEVNRERFSSVTLRYRYRSVYLTIIMHISAMNRRVSSWHLFHIISGSLVWRNSMEKNHKIQRCFLSGFFL